jgi:hypothetical protein
MVSRCPFLLPLIADLAGVLMTNDQEEQIGVDLEESTCIFSSPQEDSGCRIASAANRQKG